MLVRHDAFARPEEVVKAVEGARQRYDVQLQPLDMLEVFRVEYQRSPVTIRVLELDPSACGIRQTVEEVLGGLPVYCKLAPQTELYCISAGSEIFERFQN